MSCCVYTKDGFGDIFYSVIFAQNNDEVSSTGEQYVVFSNTSNRSVIETHEVDDDDIIFVNDGDDLDEKFRQYICYQYACSNMEFIHINKG